MSEENKAIARRWLEEFWSQGDSSVAAEIIDPGYTVYDPGMPGREGGVEGEKHTVAVYRTVFPDLRYTIEDMVGEGDRIVVRYTARGTHRGEFLGVFPTGKQVVLTGISILRVANSKIAEHWINWDTLGMLQQLGIVPATGEGRGQAQ